MHDQYLPGMDLVIWRVLVFQILPSNFTKINFAGICNKFRTCTIREDKARAGVGNLWQRKSIIFSGFGPDKKIRFKRNLIL